MTPEHIATAQACHAGSVYSSMAFPAILGTLNAAGFEGFLVDYRTGATRYYLTTGESTEMPGQVWSVALPFAATTVS